MSRFSERQFARVQPLMSAIFNHPFVVGLADGTLSKDQFIYYMQQDTLYLVDYGRALALVGARATTEKDIALGLKFASDALFVERELHGHYFSLFGVTPATEHMPACQAYTAHLLQASALGSLGEGMAALLPCFWIYNEVGKVVLQKTVAANPYEQWIKTYSDEEFEESTRAAIEYTDRLASQCSGEALERMEEAFLTSCRMEYYFWDDAYKLNTWAV